MTPRRDFDDDLDHLFGREEAERRKREHEERKESAEKRRLQMAELDKLAASRSADFTRETNAAFLVREYKARGLEPLSVDGRGVPLVGLGLLLAMGWTIEETLEGRTLVAPAHLQHRKKTER